MPAAISYPRRQQLRRLRRALGAGAGGAVALALAAGAGLAGDPILGAALVFAAAILGICARHWLRLARRSGVGARSEAEVRRALAPLAREGWRIGHGLRWAGPGDIDHVAISPTGLAFAIETKTRSFEMHHLALVRDQADWLRRRRLWCRRGAVPVLCVTCGRAESPRADVIVVSIHELTSTLRARAGTVARPGFLASRDAGSSR
jgi:nuclease-like protein